MWDEYRRTAFIRSTVLLVSLARKLEKEYKVLYIVKQNNAELNIFKFTNTVSMYIKLLCCAVLNDSPELLQLLYNQARHQCIWLSEL